MSTFFRIATASPFALALTACGGNDLPAVTATAPSPTTTTDTFQGAVPVGGVSVSPFTMAQTGAVAVTLTAAGPPPTIFMGLGVGNPSGSTCVLLSGGTTITQAGTTAQLSGTLTAGAYCVQVYDVGNQSAPVTYAVTVVHQ